MSERILVPFEDAEPAWEALEEALTRFRSDDLIVLHVLETGESSHGVRGGVADGW